MLDASVKPVGERIPPFQVLLPFLLVMIALFADGGGVVSANTDIIPVSPTTMVLSGPWWFAVDPDSQGQDDSWAAAGFDDSAWETVTVPHTWNVMGEYADYEGLAWYRRVFIAPQESAAAHVRLRFDAVFYQANVWLNGEFLGEHEGGYTPFSFDVSGSIVPGEENIIAVQVDNIRSTERIPALLRQDWSFDWWNYGGIVRDVALQLNSRAFVDRQRIVAEPNLVAMHQADTATITATVMITNTSSEPIDETLSADITLDGQNGSVLAEPRTLSVHIPPGDSVEVELTTTLDSPNLWHFDHPNLYQWKATLQTQDGKVLDTNEVTFGVRSIELKDAQFVLNGEPVRLVGLTRHADSPAHGLAETTTIMAADYNDLKTLNMVFSRPAHYPQAEYILDYCDRNGILLIPELPNWQLTARQMADEDMLDIARQQLREMIETEFNHASVWAWSVGNEYESETRAGRDYTRDIIEFVKSLDPTRPVGFASNRLYQNPNRDATRYADFVMMNQYFGTWGGPKVFLPSALDWIRDTWPDKVVIISEFGFEPRWNRLWGPPASTLNPDAFYFIPDDMSPYSDEADIQRQLVIAEQMAVYASKPFVIGAIFWTYQDYRTRTEFVMGVVNADRERRRSWYQLREAYSPILIEDVSLSTVSDGCQQAVVSLWTRGPIENALPAYTLWGYSLQWSVTSPRGDTIFAEGEFLLPTLPPDSSWEGGFAWDVPEEDYVLNLSIIRPTGFPALDQHYDSNGELLPGE